MPVDRFEGGAVRRAYDDSGMHPATRARKYQGKVAQVQASERPRLPFLVERDRDLTAIKFGDAARRAFELSNASASEPEAFALAALEAAAASNEHNAHCRAGTPIDAVVQQARRDLRRAIKTLLEVDGLEFVSRAALNAVCERLARFEADPNKDKPGGLRGLMYGQVSQWLAPHELNALAAASRAPGLPGLTLERAELVSAKSSQKSLKLALDVAHRAHLVAPDNAALKTRYLYRLKQAYCAAELVFHDAREAFLKADQANKEAYTLALAVINPDTEARWRDCQRARMEKKTALMQVAADLKIYASLRLAGLEPYCDSLPPGDESVAAQRQEALVQSASVKALINACAHVGQTLADRPRPAFVR
ncbi:hypothetical protein BH11PSE7_BH11PSE7_19480 [soil metagenome]